MNSTIQSSSFSPHVKIFDAVNQCLNQFQKYITSDRPLSRRYVSILEQRLQTWAKYSGAISRQGLSLDDRLSTLSDIKNAVLGLLHMVLSNLRRASELPDEDIYESDHYHVAVKIRHNPSMLGQDSLETDKTQVEDKWKAYQGTAWEAVSAAIDMLFEMASAIRNSGNHNTKSQVPADFKRDDDKYFDILVKTFVRKQFPHARRSLADQLGHSIFIRRRRILYQQRHEEKLAFPRAPPGQDQLNAAVVALPKRLEALQQPVRQGKRQSHLFARTEGEHSIVAPSSTELSQAQLTSEIMRRVQARSTVTGRTRGSLNTEQARPEYPSAPRTDQKYSACPYCCAPLLSSQLFEYNWIKHVDQDLRPFVCLSEKCQEPPRFYVTKKDWLQHMEKYHGRDWYQNIHMITWFCNIDHVEDLGFVDADGLQEHLLSHDISGLKQKALIRRNRSLGTREIGTCPLCEAKPKFPARLDPRQQLEFLMDHIAEHLKSIALISLPAADYIPTSETHDEDDSKRDSNRAGIADLSASLSTRSALSSLSSSSGINMDNNSLVEGDSLPVGVLAAPELTTSALQNIKHSPITSTNASALQDYSLQLLMMEHQTRKRIASYQAEFGQHETQRSPIVPGAPEASPDKTVLPEAITEYRDDLSARINTLQAERYK